MADIKNKNVVKIIMAALFCLTMGVGLFIGSFLDPAIKVINLSTIQTMEKDLETVSDAEFDSAFIELLEAMYNSAENENLLVGAFYWQLFDAEEKGITYEDGAKSNAFKGFLQDLKNGNLMIKNDILYGYLVTPDLEPLMAKYEKRMSDPLREYMEFRIYELNNHIYNPEIETLDIPEIVSRLDILHERLQAEDAGFHDVYWSLQNYYMNSLLGINHDYFVDFGKDPVWFTDYAINQYQKLAERNDDIGRHIRELLEEGPGIR